jgi:uracil-DNA glycosylase
MLDARRRDILSVIGIDLWQARSAAAPAGAEDVAGPLPAPDDGVALVPAAPAPAGVATAVDLEPVARMDWDALGEAVRGCQACALHAGRTQTVFGVGAADADLMIVGEAPGAEEDRRGEPFVGRAGQLLNAMLGAIGLDRGQVYIANIVKCRPPGNRDPHADEAAACQAYLVRQIELVAPRVILSVGRVSAHNLLGTDTPVGRLRGRAHRIDPGGVPVIVTYHPAYLLRRPEEKAKAWADLQAVARQLAA